MGTKAGGEVTKGLYKLQWHLTLYIIYASLFKISDYRNKHDMKNVEKGKHFTLGFQVVHFVYQAP